MSRLQRNSRPGSTRLGSDSQSDIAPSPVSTLVDDIESRSDREASVYSHDIRNVSCWAGSTPPPTVQYRQSSLDMFEEPLIDFATSSSTAVPMSPKSDVSSTYMKPLIPGPQAEDESVWDYVEGDSLLDFGDTNLVSQTSHTHFDAPKRSRTAATLSSRSASRATEVLSGNLAHRTQGEARPATPHHAKDFVTSNGDALDETYSEMCCDDAKNGTVKYYFCWPCNSMFCENCWSRERAHKRRVQPTGGIPHEQTDPSVAKKIQNALEADLTDSQQSELHVEDEDTSWFGAWKDEKDDMVFQDYGRYATLMAENSARRRKLRYPALVSFVGQTGAGKSTLIRLLIELCSSTNKRLQVPVVGAITNQDTPTSGDVHLYCDPKTLDGEHPVLYADCEGLEGGEREPMAARIRNKYWREDAGNVHQTDQAAPRNMRKQLIDSTSERVILWANTEQRRSRDFIVRNLYPRLLYTFSDVIVFVMKNPRVIEAVIEQLICWAAAALETSSNQPVLPHAIIVLNASENATDPLLWDVDNSTAALMKSVFEALHKNHSLRQFAEFWRQKGRSISSIEALMLSYYSRVRVVRVPERGRPKLICDQIQRLHKEIATACNQSRASKHKVRMLLNSDDLQPYLQYAFDHFSKYLDFPFDFVQASFTHKPIPSDFGGNILKLAINIMEVWKDKLDGPKIFKELSYIVASCIMLDSARHRTLGSAEKVFPEYIEHCDDALDDFCDRHWPCEYTSPRGRCVNVKVGHNTKGHQLKSGQVLAVGEYRSSFSSQRYRFLFRNDIYTALAKLLELLQEAAGESSYRELEHAANIHRDLVLRNFFNHLKRPKEFISHTACFSCLISMPEHPLPCGHVLCTPCVKAFGTSRGRTTVDINYCPLHENDRTGRFDFRCSISLKPPGAGVRILSLDGGGVRAIIELTILQQIEDALGVDLPIQTFFDLVVGTGTGGLVALGLGTQAWSVQRCIKNFKELCDKAFTKKKGSVLPVMRFLRSASKNSSYASDSLETILKSQYGHANLCGGTRQPEEPTIATDHSTKVAVTTTTTSGTVVLLANYNRSSTTDESLYQFFRSEKPSSDIKTWEAARATSATQAVFKPFGHEPSGQIFQDGSLYYNNPVDLAILEKKSIWRDVADADPDIVLSLGTGFNSQASRKITSSARILRQGKSALARKLNKASMDQPQSSHDPEETWRNFVDGVPPEKLKDRYVRFNLPLKEDPPKLDELSSILELQEMTRSECARRRDEVKSVADRLIATSFYFELKPDTVVQCKDQSIDLTGNILCRFPPGSEAIQKLGEALHKHSAELYNQQAADHDPYFIIQERWKEGEALKTIIGTHVVEKMMRDADFSFGQVTFKLSKRIAETTISLCFANTSSEPVSYPISGFPKCLLEEDRKFLTRTRQPSGLSRKRTPTTVHLRGTWTLPQHVDRTFDPIERYRDPMYINPGDATSDDISAIEERFSPLSGASSYDGNIPYFRPLAFQSMDTETQRAELEDTGVYELE